jgi:hypothetical protein
MEIIQRSCCVGALYYLNAVRGRVQLVTGRVQIDTGRVQIDTGRMQIDTGRVQIDTGRVQIDIWARTNSAGLKSTGCRDAILMAILQVRVSEPVLLALLLC